MAKPKNWSLLKNKTYTETAQGRDVYEEQQLGRGKLQDKQSMTSRLIFSIAMGVLTFIVVYLIWGFVSNLTGTFSVSSGSSRPSVNTSYDDTEGGGSQITGYPVSDGMLTPLDDGDYRSDTGAIYRTMGDGYYMDTGETVDSRYGGNGNGNGSNSSNNSSDEATYSGWKESELGMGAIFDKEKGYVTGYSAMKPVADGQFVDSRKYLYDTDGEYFYVVRKLDKAEYYALLDGGAKTDAELAAGEFSENGGTSVYTGSTDHDAGESFNGRLVKPVENFVKLKDGRYRDDAGTVYDADGPYFESSGSTVDEVYGDDISNGKSGGGSLGSVKHETRKKSLWWPRSLMQVVVSLFAGFAVFYALYMVMKKNLVAQNMLADTEDINQYTNDQHIALPEEIQRKYDWFPDVGAHSSVLVSSMISHMSLKNKGVKSIQVAKRYKKDVVDEDGVVVYHKGEIMRDADGNTIFVEMPMFDEKFSEALFEASGAPEEVRMSYDPSVIPYNPGNKNREKLQGPYDGPPIKKKQRLRKGEKPVEPGKFEMVTDLINKDWTFPEYEPQRPAGAYIVDTAPVNTMV